MIEALSPTEEEKLNEDQLQRYHQFLSDFEGTGCSCHINPPCNHCTSKGHPENLRYELENE